MPFVIKSPSARTDLLEIGQYIAVKSGSDLTAFRLLDEIENRCELLSNYPLAGELRADLGTAVRAFTVGRYVLLYRPCDDGIQLLRVIHGARDIRIAFHE